MPSEMELIAAAQKGDGKAFAELVKLFAPRIRRLCRHLVAGHADADDLSQEVFVRAHAAIARFDGRSELYTWLYRIAVNLSLNRLRALSVRKHVDVDDPVIAGSLLASECEDGGAKLEAKRLVSALADALAELPESLRVTVVLVCFDDVPQEQAATILGCSVGTVAWRVHEARKRLRERLSELGFAEALERLGGPRALGGRANPGSLLNPAGEKPTAKSEKRGAR